MTQSSEMRMEERSGGANAITVLDGVLTALLGVVLIVAPMFALMRTPDAVGAFVIQASALYFLGHGLLLIALAFVEQEGWGLRAAAGVIGGLAGISLLGAELAGVTDPATRAYLFGAIGILVGILTLMAAMRLGDFGGGAVALFCLAFGIGVVGLAWLGFGAAFALFIFGILGISAGASGILGPRMSQKK